MNIASHCSQVWKHKPGIWLLAFLLTLTVGCSSSGEVNDEMSEEEAASLDEVPAEDAETAEVPPDAVEESSNELQAAQEPEEVPGLDVPEASEGAEVAAVPPAPVEVAPEVTPVQSATASTSGESENYTVESGDTLMKIAFEKYGDLYRWKAIREWNADRLGASGLLKKGMVLRLEQPESPVTIQRNGEKYFIKEGDTLGLISGDVYGTPRKWRKLWENNRQMIRDPNRIFAGFTLYYSMTSEDLEEKNRLSEGGSQLGSRSTQGSEGQTQRSPAQQ